MYCIVVFIKITVGMIPEAARFVLVRLPTLEKDPTTDQSFQGSIARRKDRI